MKQSRKKLLDTIRERKTVIAVVDVRDGLATLQPDGLDHYRWYDDAGLDTEVSGRTIAEALQAAHDSWPELYHRFKIGFQTGAKLLTRTDAVEHWSAYSLSLSEVDRMIIELGGYSAGLTEGEGYLMLFPERAS